ARNVGFYDQLLGLKWVRENIHLFGGDKDKITIFGESAGSWSVSAHILSPLSKGMFKRAIMQSGAQFYNMDKEVVNKTEALSQAKAMAKGLKCNETEDWIQCLRRADPKDILKYENPIATYPTFDTEFLPIRAQTAFNTKKFNTDIDLIAGITRNEGSTFIIVVIHDLVHIINMNISDFHNAVNALDSIGYHNVNVPKVTEHYLKGVNTSNSLALRTALGSLIGDLILGCPTYHFAKRFAQTVKESQRVYFYELLYGSDNHMDSDWPQLLNDEPMNAPKVHGLDPKDLSLLSHSSIGVVRGRTLHVLDTNVDQFVGIPYAEPPVGKLRFAKPEHIIKPFPVNATKPTNSCMQPTTFIPIIPGTGMSEDCLVLNIWTADVKALKPVMFWIHGGGLNIGTIFQTWFNGSVLATKDVVVVSVNYRLGPFGFLYGDREDAPGN
ncbi:unnamed protein product, partial [Medioppia subpectinata]